MEKLGERIIKVGDEFEINLPDEIMKAMDLTPGDKVYYSLEGLETEDTIVLKKA